MHTRRSGRIRHLDLSDYAITPGSSLALIGNASGQRAGDGVGLWIRGVSDKETRRKPLAFAADAVRYGI